MQNKTLEIEIPIIKRRWFRICVLIASTILLIVFLAVIFGYWFLGRSLPEVDGSQIMEHLKQEVEVIRDNRGVAQINAETLEDLFFMQGYTTAQDRLFQMDMTRRLASGKLSEVVGEKALESDQYFRTYGMHRTTDELISNLDDEALQMLDAYVEGVNQYIEEAFENGRQPIEFRVLGYKPDPWRNQDTAIVIKYMGYMLSVNYKQELEHYQVIKMLGEQAKYLFPEYHINDSFPTIYEVAETSPFSFEELHKLASFAPSEFNGSNNWVISGEHTESGFPMIANDPHLRISIPSVWYQTHLNLKNDFHSIGVTVPGVPGVVLGHNEHMAWGVSALVVDQQDLFLEQVHPENPQLYLYDGAWEEATVIEEVITIKDEDEPHIERVEITRNGPVINKVVDDAPYQAISLNWTGYTAGQELKGILKINRSRNAIEFNEALDGFVTPALSWVFADQDGNIGYRGQSLIPIREKSNGLFPVPGWDPDYQWKGFIPDDELPQIINPERGYIVTANNKPVDDEYPYEIGRSFYPYRAGRLTEIVEQQIESKQPFTVQLMQEMQVDFLNTEARVLLPILLDAVDQTQSNTTLGGLESLEQEVVQLLENWDFVEDHDSAAALVWYHWYNHMNDALFTELFGFQYTNPLVISRVLQDAHGHPSQIVFSELDEKHQLMLDTVAKETLIQAIESTVELQGKNPDKWEWGKFHSLTIKHPLGALKPLNLLFDVGSWELGGSGATPGALGYNRKKEEFSHGAGWRFAGDLASLDSFYDIVIPGQSGQLSSPYYSDQVDIWAQGGLLPMIYQKGKDDMNVMIFRPKQ